MTGRRSGHDRGSALDRFTEWVLSLVVPEDLRESFVGDLVEEADGYIAPARGLWRARLWLWRQVLGSLPATVRRRWDSEGALDMRMWKLIVVPMVLLGLQRRSAAGRSGSARG